MDEEPIQDATSAPRARLDALLGNRSDYVTQLAESFDHAKKLSDFIGMLVRLAFCIGLTLFFFYNAQIHSAGFLESVEYGTCLVVSIFITLYFTYMINRIIFFYMMRNVVSYPGKLFRVFFLLISLVMYLGILQGITDISYEAARLSKLTQPDAGQGSSTK